MFLACEADICFYGGSAGGGKSYGLLLDVLRHLENAKFQAVIFRRETPEITNPGGLWDESEGIYSLLGAHPREAFLKWRFPSGMEVKFAHLEREGTKYKWHGSQVPYFGFDEVTSFTEGQFFYMFSRNRTALDVQTRIRATCNPDPDSFVRQLIDWWIGPDGFAIPERSGVIRWFIRLDEKMIWADSKEELHKKYGHGPEIQPKSFTFIRSRLQDNKILRQNDPGYLANLMALSKVDRMRLLEGNWNVRAEAGDYFQRGWFPLVDEVPGGWIRVIRAWDRAGTRPNPGNKNPDWTRGVLLYVYPNGTYCIADLKSIQDNPGKVDKFIKQVAQHDGYGVSVRAFQDPGSAGKKEAEDFIKQMNGYDVKVESVSEKKHIRAKPFSRQCEAGNVMVLRGNWNGDLFNEYENFGEDPKKYAHDDIVDASSLAYYSGKVSSEGFQDDFVDSFSDFMRTGQVE